jgi:hypothetical protein
MREFGLSILLIMKHEWVARGLKEKGDRISEVQEVAA